MTSLRLTTTYRPRYRRLNIKSICVAVVALTMWSVAVAKTITIMNVDRVTFDDSRLQEKDVLHWFRLSPTVAPYNDYLVPPSVWDCPVGDSRYSDCGNRPTIPIPSNAQVNIASIEAVLRDLLASGYPPELSDVRAYLINLQEFFLWRNIALLQFIKTDNPEVLEAPYGALDPKILCGTVLGQIRAAPTRERRFSLASVDWANCVWDAQHEKLGDYPQKVWDTFLTKYSIREEPIPETGD